MEFYLSPTNLIGDISSTAVLPAFEAIGQGIKMLFAKTELKISPECSILYGTKMEVHQGSKVEHQYKDDEKLPALHKTLVKLITIFQLMGVLWGGSKPTYADGWQDGNYFILQLPWQIAISALFVLENLSAFRFHAQESLEEAKKTVATLVDVTTLQLTNPEYKLPKFTDKLTDVPETHATAAATNATEAAKMIVITGFWQGPP